MISVNIKFMLGIIFLIFVYGEIYSQYLDENQVIEVNSFAFAQQNVAFTTGQSLRLQNDPTPRLNTISFEIAVFVPIITYGRLIELRNENMVSINGGVAWFDGLLPLASVTVLLGGPRHYFETGPGLIISDELLIPIFYRFHAKNGLRLKGGFELYGGVIPFPSVALGHAF